VTRGKANDPTLAGDGDALKKAVLSQGFVVGRRRRFWQNCGKIVVEDVNIVVIRVDITGDTLVART
jgi:hypothetical protein